MSLLLAPPAPKPLTTPVPYFGAKTRVAARIVALMPPHQHYVEPFAGSLAVLLAKPRSSFETVNDLDGFLVTFWRVLRDQPDDLERVCALTPHSRAEYWADNPAEPGIGDLEVARRVFVRLTQGRGRSLHGSMYGWRHYGPSTSKGTTSRFLERHIERLCPAAARLAGVQIENKPAFDLIDEYNQTDDQVIYADPPYPASCRTSGHPRYMVEADDDQFHRELAERLHAVAGTVLVSGYHSPLYDRLYEDWQAIDLPVQGNGHNGTHRTETVWTNQPTNKKEVLL